MLNYTTAAATCFASGVVPDGYSGRTAQVKFHLTSDGHIVTVTDSGCFNTGLPLASDIREAFWLLRQHPSSRAKRVEWMI